MSDIFEILDGTPDDNFYLTLNEESTYIDVFCDGYYVRVYTNNSGIGLYNNSDVVMAYLGSGFIYEGSFYYKLTLDSNKTIEIIEDTPTRVRIRIVGNLYENGTPGYLANSDNIEIIYTFYADRFTTDIKHVTSGTITIGTISQHCIDLEPSAANLTNEVVITESSGSEITTTGDRTVSDYYGIKSDEINIHVIVLDHDEQGATFISYVNSASQLSSGYSTATDLTAGTHTFSALFIIDSQEREYGQKKYTETERLEMGEQYKDLFIS